MCAILQFKKAELKNSKNCNTGSDYGILLLKVYSMRSLFSIISSS